MGSRREAPQDAGKAPGGRILNFLIKARGDNDKMKRLKQAGMVLCAVILVVLVCSRRIWFDAEKAVDASMKAILQENTEDFADITGETPEDVEKEYNELITGFVKNFESIDVFSDDFPDKCTDAVKNILASGKYEIQGSKKIKGKNYTVKVAVYPSDVMTIALDQIMKNAIALSGQVTSEKEWKKSVESGALEAFESAVKKQTYGDPVVCQIYMTHDEEYVYEFNEDDMSKILNTMFPIPESLIQPTGTDYDNEYLNWMPSDWQAASDEEKTNCCLAMVQKIYGFTDDQMAMTNPDDPSAQEGVGILKEALDTVFDGGFNISVGDYVTLMMDAGAGE